MDWLALRPEQLVDRAEPKDLLPQLRTVRELPRESRKLLDFALRQWTMSRLSRQTDTEGILELDDLAAIALQALPQSEDAAGYRIRWQAFRDLLESKRLAIGSRESGRARNLLHAGPILDLLGSGPLAQSELRAKLKLSPARLSQVLGVMEEGGLIERRKRGKESFVSLAMSNALPTGAPRSPASSAGAQVWRLAA